MVSASARASPRPSSPSTIGRPGDLMAQAPGSPSVHVMSSEFGIFGGSAEDAQDEVVPGLVQFERGHVRGDEIGKGHRAIGESWALLGG